MDSILRICRLGTIPSSSLLLVTPFVPNLYVFNSLSFFQSEQRIFEITLKWSIPWSMLSVLEQRPGELAHKLCFTCGLARLLADCRDSSSLFCLTDLALLGVAPLL